MTITWDALLGCTAAGYFPRCAVSNDGAAQAATSAEFCFDGDCTTVKALAGPDDVFNGFNVDTWEQGRSVELRVTVFDASGTAIDSLTDTQTMDSSGCACGVVFYAWKDGQLHQVN